LMVPFALLPLDVGYRIWAALLCASYVGCGVALAPGGPLGKTAQVLLSLVPYPVALGLGLGQPIALQMAALACAVHLLRRDRDLLAGVCLLAVAVKPQCMVLVPFALLASGRIRAFASFAAASALLAAALLALIGFDGANAYLARLRHASAHPEEFWVSWSINLSRHFASDLGRLSAQGAAAAAAFVAARRHRSSEIAIAAGLVGSLLVTPFLHL
jgi:Glycosyltransferase family 87